MATNKLEVTYPYMKYIIYVIYMKLLIHKSLFALSTVTVKIQVWMAYLVFPVLSIQKGRKRQISRLRRKKDAKIVELPSCDFRGGLQRCVWSSWLRLFLISTQCFSVVLVHKLQCCASCFWQSRFLKMLVYCFSGH